MADPAANFVHLHVHSQYSLLDGACRTADLPRRAKELGMASVAITDHGALFGLVDFYSKCHEHGVKPILGMEAYMAPGARSDRNYTGGKDGGYHLLLLVQNQLGYQNLLKLSSIAYKEGFYYKPRIDKEILRQFSGGLIATSACLGGEIPSALTASDRKRARDIAETYLSIFGPDRFFIELQSHVPEQAAVNPELVDLADRLGIGVVATNDVHFLLPDDHAPHNALCCIATGKLVTDESRLIYPTQLYLKSPQEMRAAAPDLRRWSEACDNSLRIASMCDFELKPKSHAPVVKIEHECAAESIRAFPHASMSLDHQGSTEWYIKFCSQFRLMPFHEGEDDESPQELAKECDKALRRLAEAGLIWRYKQNGITAEIRARLDRELKILADKRISAYFLIVWDFVNWARQRGIPAMARGSGVGTMVGYCLGLSNACPVHYGLLFERFTDPDRAEFPDIDIDICQDGRAQVIDYVRRKYGHVAQIITFGTLKAKAVIRDVGRVMNIPLPEVDRIAKLVPEELGVTLEKALEKEPDLRREYQDNPQTRRLLDIGKRLEGLARHASVHAAGVIVATQPLDSIVPLYKDPKSDDIITQWDGPTCEKVGLLKMDFLGLRTLSIVERAKKLIGESFDPDIQRRAVLGGFGAGPRPDSPREFGVTDPKAVFDPMDLDRLTYRDQNVLDLFRRGETAGVFQFESGGMRSLLIGMQPDRLEDLIAANALFRPGPMDLIPHYNDRKNQRAPIPRVHPVVDAHTAETYGVMVYQEQVMQILHHLGGIALREAYSIIKAISKKKEKTIQAARDTFVAGAQKQGLTAAGAEELFDLILKFAGYGFNKSHSTGYAIVAYQTAYLKTYFPLQYMAALLTFESVSIDKVTEYTDECRRILKPDGQRGVEVRPPDINVSKADFAVVFDPREPHDPNHGHIRYGLTAVKGVGEKAVAAILEARDRGGAFKSVFDFCERVPQGTVNKATIEALVKCGAFDALHGAEKRAAMVACIEQAVQRGAQEAALRNSDDFLFGAAVAAAPATAQAEPALPDVPAWDASEMLLMEKAVLGLYVSSHPLQRWQRVLERFSSVQLRDARKLRADAVVTVGGMISRVRPTFVKHGRSAGQKMAMITLEDFTGSMDGVIFSDAYARHAHLATAENIVFLVARIDRRREEPNLVVEKIIPVAEAVQELTSTVRITLRELDDQGRPLHYNGELAALRTLLRQSPGAVPVYFEIVAQDRTVLLHADRYKVAPDPDLPSRVQAILRLDQCCQLLGPPKLLVAEQSAAADQQVIHRLHKQAGEEVCASIDRY
jgi:DNA polymerase-3 subunit alpha